jgi:hypothetical protein
MSLHWKLVERELNGNEKLLMTEHAAGYNGVLVSFGDGCDDDTLNLVFHSAYVIRVTPFEGEDFDLADGHTFTFKDGYVVLRGRKFDDDLGKGIGEEFDTPFEDIVAIQIY